MLKLKVFFIIFFYSILINGSIGLENKIVLKIDKEIITSLDIDKEIRYLVALNPNIENIENNKLYKLQKILKKKVKEIELLKNQQKTKFDEIYLDQLRILIRKLV